MKHPKDRGDRIRSKRNNQHKALFHNGLYRPKVEEDRRAKVALKSVIDEINQHEKEFEHHDD